MAEQQPVYLDEHGNPQSGAVYLDEHGEPIGGTPQAMTTADMLKLAAQPGGIRPSMTEGELVNEPSLLNRLNEQLRGPAHPSSAGDVALSVLLPEVPGALVSGAKTIAANLKGTLQTGSLLKAPGRIIGRVVERFNDPLTIGERNFRDAPLYKQMEALDTRASGPIEALGSNRSGGPPAQSASGTTAHLDRSVPARPSELTQEQIADRLKFGMGTPPEIQRNAMGRPVKPPGVLRTKPPETAPPITVNEASLPEAWKGFAEQPQMSPLQEPRVQSGAERVGRATGLTKEQVRQQTSPILGEQPGEASPIFPRDVLGRIVDTVKALPVSEREAYVARATSGKAQWQIENIRRTLEHLGLLVPVAAMRQSIMERLAGRAAPTGSQ